jgi:NADH-quinone oxidoreductase subunit L
MLMGVSVGGAVLALIYAYIKYVSKAEVPLADNDERPALEKLSFNKFYIDEIYDAIIRRPLDALSVFFYKVVDKMGIDGLVNGVAQSPIEAGRGLRLLQTGNVGFYLLMMVIGIVAVLLYSLIQF